MKMKEHDSTCAIRREDQCYSDHFGFRLQCSQLIVVLMLSLITFLQVSSSKIKLWIHFGCFCNSCSGLLRLLTHEFEILYFFVNTSSDISFRNIPMKIWHTRVINAK